MRVYPIIKCTDIACNLKCEYCFYRDLDQTVKPQSIMSQEVLERLTEQLLEINPQKCEFLWHGGEPLLAGLDFFKTAIELQHRAQKNTESQIKNSIQTNGVLINQEWAEFFKKHGFTVGISIDGSSHMHDRYRTKAGGNGSFKAVMRGIQTCRNEGVQIGAIAAVTSYNAQFPDELYHFFVDNGLKKFSLNPVFETDRADQLCDFSVSNESLTDFLSRILELWLQNDDPEIEIRQFTEPLVGMLGGQIKSCIYSGLCRIFLDIHPNGNVQPCHSIRGEVKVLGNIVTHHLRDIITSERYEQFSTITLKLPTDCFDCRWFSVCHGGCTDHRNVLVDGKLYEKYIHCDSRKRIFEILDQVVKLSSN
jgi:uncharacterized protein